MTHDPETYDEPMSFKPERFNNSDTEMKQVYDLVFGFGRRTCPGMHFAEGTIFSVIATTFATCDVLPEFDNNGKPIFPELIFTDGVIRLAYPSSSLQRDHFTDLDCLPASHRSTSAG